MSAVAQSIRVSVGDGVATVVLNRPEARNALSSLMVHELLGALDDAMADAAVRSVVLTGEGEVFCAGGDLADMSAKRKHDAPALRGDYADLLLAMARARKPIVARVNGHALGGGLGLVAASTFACASTEAKLGTPEINVGVFPMMVLAVLRRVVPRRKLLDMVLFGERMSAGEAVLAGLLSQAVPAQELDRAVSEITARIGAKSPITIELGLSALAAQEELSLEAALPMLRERLAGVIATNDAKEGLTAFLQKRPPSWTGT